MKLPENKKDRIQVFVLIGIGFVAVLYAIVQLVISPYLASKQKLRETLRQKQEKLEKAQRELNFAPNIKTEFDSVTAELDKIIEANVLRPILGSYLVGVSETLETQARLCSIKLDEITEIGIRELPRAGKKDTAVRNFKSYAVQVTATVSYEQATSFMNKLEELNPYLCISDIRLTGQTENPERHRLVMRIEWPIETDFSKEPPPPAGRGGKS